MRTETPAGARVFPALSEQRFYARVSGRV